MNTAKDEIAAAAPTEAMAPTAPTALSRGLWRCQTCAGLWRPPPQAQAIECPRCGSTVYARRPQSASRCAALLLAAALLYVPANLLPVSVLDSLQGSESDTIFGGIVLLWQGGSWPLALLVLVASIVVPMSKLLVLSYLLVAARRGWHRGRPRRARLYRALVAIGRWSMLDIYVVALLAALVRIPSLAAITPGPGAIAFGAVVVLTMLATHAFDPRLIWDAPRPR